MQFAVGTEVAAAVGVVDHPGLAVDAADEHHHVAGDVDQVADVQRRDRSHALRARVAGLETGAREHWADRLVAGIARQLHAHAAIDLGHETAAIAAVVGMAPAVAFAEELEGLADQVGAGQRQVVGFGTGVLLQQRGREAEAAVIAAHRQIEDPRTVGMLSVDRLVERGVRQRNARAHVQLQFGQARFLAGEHGARFGTGDHAIRTALRVGQHGGLVAFGDGLRFHPRGIARTDHEQPLAVGAGVHDRHRIARKQRAFLEAVDVAVVVAAEHA